MKKTMKGLVWYGANDMRYEDWPIPEVGPDDALIQVAYSGICGSEMSIIHGTNTHGAKPPKILGHEFSGTIAALGSNVKNYRIGDKVTAHPHAGCGGCYFCQRGQEGFCQNAFNFITSKDSGAFGEYTLVRAKNLYKLPDHMSLKTASLIEPISIAVHAFSLIRMQPGDSVIIQGGGTIGLCCLLIAKACGAGQIILSEPMASRLELARRFGADIVVNPLQDSLEDAARRVCKYGVDLNIEAAGNPKTCEAAIPLTKSGGTVLVVGVCPPDKLSAISFGDINKREIHIIGANWSPYSFDRTIEIMRRFNPDPLITHEFGLEQYQAALQTQEDKSAVKTTFKFV